MFFLLWRVIGLFLLPLLALHPKARRHIFRVPYPSPGCIWIHGASAGEHKAIRALLPHLNHPHWRTYSSWRTPINAAPAPMDLPLVFSRWLDWARPSMLILVEAELWPGWIAACRKRSIPIVVVNARPSPSQKWWTSLGLWNRLTRDILFLPQSIYGDLKAAAMPPKSRFTFPKQPFIAASTHQEDEALLIPLWSKHPSLPPLLIAPRHIERVDEIERICRSLNLSVERISQKGLLSSQIWILDTFGELDSIMSHGCGAYIGGTQSPRIGGHSPSEANRNGLRVLHGPYIFRNPQAWKDAVSIEINVDDADSQIRSIIEQGTYKPIPNTTAQGYVRALPERNRPRATLLRPYLYPLSWIWRGLNHINKRFTNKFYADLPVISVGGISAGGSGKTEIAAWLAHNLKESVVLSRGYKRPKGGSDIRSQHLLGDELEMLRRRGIPVLSSPNKIAGIKAALSSGYKRVIIDDGFQSFYIHRNMNILTIDANWPRARGEFPVGWGRESMRAIDRADLIWIHNWTSDCRLSFQKPMLYSWYKPIGWLHRGRRYPLEHKRGEAVAICGISNPTSFWTMLAQIPEIHIKEWIRYPNHAPLPKPPSGCIVTEKDAARLSPDADVWALRIKLVVSATPHEKPNAIC